MGVTSRQKDETHFCKESCFPLFRKLPDYTKDIETEWDLFKSAVITSAAASCGCKYVGGQMSSKKKLFGGTKKLKKLSVQKKLRLELS